MNDAIDRRYMARALRLAEGGLYTARPNPRVGCVLVRDNRIVGEGFHLRAGTAHAEVNALSMAGDSAQGATAYVSLEPCCHQGRTPACTEALIQAGVARVVAATLDPNPLVSGKGLETLSVHGIECKVGVLEDQAVRMNAGFVQRMVRGRPWVRLKVAISLDGRTALSTGESKWITGAAARADVQRWRARSCAIMTGRGTLVADDPRLDARFKPNAQETDDVSLQPARIVLDSTLASSSNARWLTLPGRKILFSTRPDRNATSEFSKAGAEIIVVGEDEGRVDLPAVFGKLAEMEFNEIQVEAGATLNGALLEQGLVDELIIYIAPHLLGDTARGLASLPSLLSMDQRMNLQIEDIRAVGNDWRIQASLKQET